MSTRTTCGGCGGGELEPFLDLGKTPLANTYPADADAPETWYALGLCRCLDCALVQGTEVVADKLIYDDEYGFYSGGSVAQQRYHRAGARLLLRRHGELARRLTIEVACNDGSLLNHFAQASCPVLGVDPAKPADVAITAGLPVVKQALTAALGAQVRSQHGPAGLVIMYNALAHVADLADVLAGLRALLADDGVVVIEVQYVADLLAHNLFDQVYHEHRYFYSLTSLSAAAQQHGLHVLDAELIELQGGGLRVTLGARPTHAGNPLRVEAIRLRERWLSHAATYASLQDRVDRVRDHLVDLLRDLRQARQHVAGYAAAAKATTILNYCGVDAEMLPYVLDETAYKHGRYVPGVKIPIYGGAPGAPPDVQLLLSGNYLGHVLRSQRAFTDRGGRWLLALPSPALI